MSGASSALTNSRLSRDTISRGVAAGANMPYHNGIVKPSTPASIPVGTSGRAAMRCSVSTARARTFPARICGIAVVTGMTTSSTSPPIIAVIAWVTPL